MWYPGSIHGAKSRVLCSQTADRRRATNALSFVPKVESCMGLRGGFMEACRSELNIQACELQSTSIAVAEENGKVVGVAQVKVNEGEADLLKLFVEPTMLRRGVG